MATAQQLEAAILALEAQRSNLGDAVVDVALAPLRAQLSALRATDAARIRLRQVTVLFADIVGSTALGAQLDAEDTVAIVGGALARFGAIVEAQRGRVARFTGDGLKGVFGADAGNEDAAENAVRAGLAILADAEAYAAVLRQAHGVTSFQVRVGVNTGAVALGGGVEADNSAVGTAVNLAARLEQAAPAGGLLISQDTFAQVRGMFDVIDQPPLLVKGHAAPLLTFLVQRARPREFRVTNRGVVDVDMRMLGRDAELARLESAYIEVEATRQLHAVTVVGDAGVGKSRLLGELRRVLHARGLSNTTLLARARPQLQLQPYGLLREMLAASLQIADTDSAEVARGKWHDGLAPFVETGDAEMLGHLVGLDFSASPQVARIKADARQLRDRAFRAAFLWLQGQTAGARAPLVMFLDDVHWADQGTLNWLRHLLQDARDLPLLLVMLARPALVQAHPDWADGTRRHQRIDLAPLNAETSRALARALLQRLDDIPPALLDIVTRGGSGNPFYMEELVNMLIDDGVIIRSNDNAAWKVAAERLRGIRVPPTIAGVLQSRIDALGERERSALQQASVIGPVFWDAALDALEPDASGAIPTLSERQMTARKDPSTFADCAEFAFSHHLLHQATYDTVLKAARRSGHARAAAWLSARVHDRSLEHLGATADHFERAGEREPAARFFARAAQAAADRYANDAALEHVRRALDNIDPADTGARFTMLHLRQRVLDVLGERDAQSATLDEMAALFSPGTAPREEAQIALGRALLADRGGDFPNAIRFAQQATVLAEAEAMWSVAARACGEVAFVLTRDGKFDAASEKVAVALDYARRSAEALAEAQILAVWANLEDSSHRPLRAIELLEQASALANAHGHTRLAGLLHGNLGQALLEVGDFEQARTHQEASLRIGREIGNRSAEANALGGFAGVLLALGDYEAALTTAQQAVELTTALGDRYSCAHWQMRLGEALFLSGRSDEAVEAYGKADALIRSTGTLASVLDPAVRIAEVVLDRGDAEQAARVLEPVLAADAVTLDASMDPLRVEFIVYRVLHARREARAIDWLRAAHDRLQVQAGRLPQGTARERLLFRIPRHRAVLEAYAAVQ